MELLSVAFPLLSLADSRTTQLYVSFLTGDRHGTIYSFNSHTSRSVAYFLIFVSLFTVNAQLPRTVLQKTLQTV